MKYKIGAYVLAWMTALVATDPSFSLWALIYMFPLGLWAFLFPEDRQSGGWIVLLSTVALYLVHAVFYFRSRTTALTAILFGALVLLLICNVAGCRAMIHVH